MTYEIKIKEPQIKEIKNDLYDIKKPKKSFNTKNKRN